MNDDSVRSYVSLLHNMVQEVDSVLSLGNGVWWRGWHLQGANKILMQSNPLEHSNP